MADIFVVDKVIFSFRFVSWHLLNCHRLWRLSQCNHVNKGKEKRSVFPCHDSGMEIKTYFWNAFRFLTFQSSFARLSWLYVRRKKKNNAENERRNDAMLNACRRNIVSMEGRKVT